MVNESVVERNDKVAASNGAHPATPTVVHRWAPLTESAVKQAGLAAAVLYGIVSLGYRGFYDSLGVRPEEVGVDRARIVTQAAIALVFLLGLASAMGVVLDLGFVPLRNGWCRLWHLSRWSPATRLTTLPEGPSPGPRSTWLAGLILIPAVIAIYMLYVAVPIASTDAGTKGGRALAAAGLLLVALAAARWRLARRDPRIQYKAWAVLAALFGVVALLVASGEMGRAQARYLIKYGHLSSTADAPASLIAITATCVQATALAQAPMPPPSDRLLLLGSSAGIEVVWDVATRQIIRLPIASSILRSCPTG